MHIDVCGRLISRFFILLQQRRSHRRRFTDNFFLFNFHNRCVRALLWYMYLYKRQEIITEIYQLFIPSVSPSVSESVGQSACLKSKIMSSCYCRMLFSVSCNIGVRNTIDAKTKERRRTWVLWRGSEGGRSDTRRGLKRWRGLGKWEDREKNKEEAEEE